MKKVGIVLDMDPGVDDAVMLLLALNDPNLEVLAVTAVSGNVNVNKATTNALKVIEASAKKGVPVYIGANRALKRRRPIHAEFIHGSDGLGNSNLPPLPPSLKPEKMSAVEKLVELLKAQKKSNEIFIVATGPLTNIAMLLEKEPSLANRLRVFTMGGIYNPNTTGNVSRHAEFNFYCDPEAADIVMRSVAKGATIVVSGLDLTSDQECAVDMRTLSSICAIDSKVAKTACRILEYPVRKYGFFHLHDVFALFSLIHPEIFAIQTSTTVRVDCSRQFRGKCMITTASSSSSAADEGGRAVAALHTCGKVDRIKFREHLLRGLM